VAKDLRTRVRRLPGEAETNIAQDRAARIMQHVSAPGEGGMYHISCIMQDLFVKLQGKEGQRRPYQLHDDDDDDENMP
jgi:hypothetical protein